MVYSIFQQAPDREPAATEALAFLANDLATGMGGRDRATPAGRCLFSILVLSRVGRGAA